MVNSAKHFPLSCDLHKEMEDVHSVDGTIWSTGSHLCRRAPSLEVWFWGRIRESMLLASSLRILMLV